MYCKIQAVARDRGNCECCTMDMTIRELSGGVRGRWSGEFYLRWSKRFTAVRDSVASCAEVQSSLEEPKIPSSRVESRIPSQLERGIPSEWLRQWSWPGMELVSVVERNRIKKTDLLTSCGQV